MSAASTLRHSLVIVAGLELDETSDDVVRQLQQFVRGSPTAEVHLCHVCDGDQSNPERAMEQLAQCERRVMAWAQAELDDAALLRQTRLHVALGEPAEVLSSLAAQVRADLVVIGTHRKNRWQRLIEGSLVRELVEKAHCAVCVASADPHPPAEATTGQTAALASPPHAAGAGAHRYRRSIPLAVPQSTVGPTA